MYQLFAKSASTHPQAQPETLFAYLLLKSIYIASTEVEGCLFHFQEGRYWAG